MAAEWLRNEHYVAPWIAKGTALDAVHTKDPAELTRDDAMTVACDAITFATVWSPGVPPEPPRPPFPPSPAGTDVFSTDLILRMHIYS